MTLDNTLREMAQEMGADFFGVADVTRAREAMVAQGGAMVDDWPRAVSLGIALLHPIVDQLPEGSANRGVAIEYRHHAYDLVNQRLDMIAARLGSLIQREGYRAMPIPASRYAPDGRLMASFSHKMAARLAGLGWIGKSCLLVTPQNGPRVRWATVLTDAPIAATGEAMERRCEDCLQCVEICPVQAFTGAPFREDEPRSVRYAAEKCSDYLNSLKEQYGDPAVCGLCLYVCPHGRR